MSTLLDDITTYVAEHTFATVSHLLAEFGAPLSNTGACGLWKTYTDLVFHRGGQFVHVQHRDFGDGEQAIRVREVEPMEKVTVTVEYVPATADQDPHRWHHNTNLVPTVERFLEALAPTQH